MTPVDAVAAYLDGVAAEATDRPRARAAGYLAEALRRSPDAEPPTMLFLEQRVAAHLEGDPDTAAEIVYEVGSIMVELRDRFPHLPHTLLTAG
ncbi:MAG: hypothetical protein AVDCRST_MAG77-4540 [uncultured Chloroflexi bacterium]|uniref:Uncharacterized protein n=1 Tax=uncultured Chloroflexota bacterium TaxID=166587 RepID=A0A6J4JVJ8_9CHLR|nr:MAG: hypothetical protein AVDCRST_MAG77-4540 [uncultured Chloroflexota bacterium]